MAKGEEVENNPADRVTAKQSSLASRKKGQRGSMKKVWGMRSCQANFARGQGGRGGYNWSATHKTFHR